MPPATTRTSCPDQKEQRRPARQVLQRSMQRKQLSKTPEQVPRKPWHRSKTHTFPRLTRHSSVKVLSRPYQQSRNHPSSKEPRRQLQKVHSVARLLTSCTRPTTRLKRKRTPLSTVSSP